MCFSGAFPIGKENPSENPNKKVPLQRMTATDISRTWFFWTDIGRDEGKDPPNVGGSTFGGGNGR